MESVTFVQWGVSAFIGILCYACMLVECEDAVDVSSLHVVHVRQRPGGKVSSSGIPTRSVVSPRFEAESREGSTCY